MFPSLIGSLKTTYGPIGYNSETGFPSLIGSLKTDINALLNQLQE